MKTRNWQIFLATVTVAGLAASACTVRAQDAQHPAAAASAMPALPIGTKQILDLEQAKISDDVVVAYVKSTPDLIGSNYLLRQHGVSDAVIGAMLVQRPPPKQPPLSAPAPPLPHQPRTRPRRAPRPWRPPRRQP